MPPAKALWIAAAGTVAIVAVGDAANTGTPLGTIVPARTRGHSELEPVAFIAWRLIN